MDRTSSVNDRSGLGRRVARGAAASTAFMAAATPRRAAAQDGTPRVGLINFPPNMRPLEDTGSSQAAVKLMISAGPFRMGNVVRGSSIEVERFADFYKPGRPRVVRIRYTAYGDDDLRIAAEECAIVWFARRSQAFGVQTRVTGYRNVPGSNTFYAPTSLEEAAMG
ncbi:MAG: hypothetical protein FJX57_04855 [Alphaproteobacteria bacterium]|nr:hypothetical protein [Alphaproteobacteria bacterium]